MPREIRYGSPEERAQTRREFPGSGLGETSRSREGWAGFGFLLIPATLVAILAAGLLLNRAVPTDGAACSDVGGRLAAARAAHAGESASGPDLEGLAVAAQGDEFAGVRPCRPGETPRRR